MSFAGTTWESLADSWEAIGDTWDGENFVLNRHAVLSWVNHVAASTTIRTASSSAGDLTIDNIADPIVGKRWRTTDRTGWGQVDFGSEVSLRVLALRFPRDTMGAIRGTVRHLLDADGGTPGTGDAYDSALVSIGAAEGYGYHLHVLPVPVTARYWRFQFNATGVSYIDVGLAWAGTAFQPARNFAFGYSDDWEDRSLIEEAGRSGAEYVDERPERRVIAFALPSMTSEDRDTIRELKRVVGIKRQVLFVRDPADTSGKEIVIGRLRETSPILWRALPLRSTAFTIRESL